TNSRPILRQGPSRSAGSAGESSAVDAGSAAASSAAGCATTEASSAHGESNERSELSAGSLIVSWNRACPEYHGDGIPCPLPELAVGPSLSAMNISRSFDQALRSFCDSVACGNPVP